MVIPFATVDFVWTDNLSLGGDDSGPLLVSKFVGDNSYWNTAKVRIEGKYPKITTWINGLKVCEFDGAAATTARYDKEGIFEKLNAEGSIAVQVHGGTGWPKGATCRWKNIKVRPL